MIILSAESKDAVQSRENQIENNRTSFDAGWQEQREYILPWHGRNLHGAESDEDNDGRLKSHKIIDGTATRALGVSAAGMQAGINSPARPWFKLGLKDKDLQEFKPVRVWLDAVEKIIRDIYAKSNMYDMFHTTYIELLCFATSCSAIIPNFDTVVRARPFTIGEFWLGLNADNKVDTFMRRYSQSARQMVMRFGIDNVSNAVRSAYENKSTESTFQVTHFIEPNDNRIRFPFDGNKAYRNLYHEKGFEFNKALLATGSEVFPILAPRWQTVGAMAYGFGPGHSTIGDIKGLQLEKEKQLIALDKLVEPPLVGPSSLEDQVVNTMPGGITFDDSLTQNAGLRPLYQITPDLSGITMGIQDTRNAIRQGLFTDLFTMIANSVDVTKTATEVAALKEEKMMVLGPVLDSVHNELHGPAIDTTYHYADKADLFPEPPEEIEGMEIEVEYISILAQAQKMIATTGIEQVASYVGNLSAIYPEARHKFNATQSIDEYADAVGVSSKIINSDEEVEAMQEAEARQAQMQTAMGAAAAAADSAKVMSETDMGGNSALAALTRGLPGTQ